MSDRAIGVVVLTMGRRPDDLNAGIASLLNQTGVDLDIVVVGNGWEPVGLDDRVRTLGLAENVGIPAGRNAGVPHVSGDLLFFLDDDARLPGTDALARMAELFEQRSDLGLVQPRVQDPDGLLAPGRWVPRLRVGDPAESSYASNVWEGAVMMRRGAFDAVGGWPEEFFYAHEGIDIAWRTWDAGYCVWYAGDIEVNHPANDPARFGEFYRLNARNRVWLARRNLPVALEPVYTGVWAAASMLRVKGKDNRKAWREGFAEGWRTRPAVREPMKWSTVWRMAKAGRPPVI